MHSPTSYEAACAIIDDLNPFLAHLESTPEDAWQVDVVRSADGSRNCMFGHLYQFSYDHPSVAALTHEQRELFASRMWDAFEQSWSTTYRIYPVNDGTYPGYDQATPKARVLAYLRALQAGEELTTMQSMDAEMAWSDAQEAAKAVPG